MSLYKLWHVGWSGGLGDCSKLDILDSKRNLGKGIIKLKRFPFVSRNYKVSKKQRITILNQTTVRWDSKLKSSTSRNFLNNTPYFYFFFVILIFRPLQWHGQLFLLTRSICNVVYLIDSKTKLEYSPVDSNVRLFLLHSPLHMQACVSESCMLCESCTSLVFDFFY